MSAYATAGVPEYWLLDAWGAGPRFDIFKRGKKEYTAVRKSAGWSKSAALGKAFRLTQVEDEEGESDFTLEIR
ncbi:PDDEXK family nuclease [Frigoriglobus tundricola]|uniref:hypothetical protein n=1 Tax=Frigoriglobus tundricola TaxID=2774151 RepID=UPI00148ECDBC|nr:hypothetical protein [Frigoriglobus tundricola]